MKAITADRAAREVATGIVLDVLRDEIDGLGLDQAQRGKLHAALFEAFEEVVEATRAGERRDREAAIELAVETKEMEHEEVLARVEAEVMHLDDKTAERLRAALQKTAA